MREDKMTLSLHTIAQRALLVGVLMSTFGCASSMKQWEPDKKGAQVYSVSFRQTAPQPTYNRRRWVNFPDLLPEGRLPSHSEAALSPEFHLKLDDTPLSEAGQVLAQMARYSSSCTTRCDATVSVEAIGTIDELAQLLSRKSGIRFSVDHSAKKVRVGREVGSKGRAVAPTLYKNNSRG